jgi:hypothetical protein
LAVDESGNVAIAFDDRVEVNAEGGIVRSLPITAVSALSFAPNGSLAAAQRELKSIALVREPAGGSEIAAAITERDGLAGPLAVVFDRENRLLAVDDAGMMFVLDLASNELRSFPCDCNASTMDTTGSGNAYVLGKSDFGPLWMLAPGSNPRVFFVPRTAGGSE